MKCPSCNNEVSPEWKRCPYCEYKPKLCSKVGCQSGWLPTVAHFCPICGSPVKGEENLRLKEIITSAVEAVSPLSRQDNVAPSDGGNLDIEYKGVILGQTTIKDIYNNKEWDIQEMDDVNMIWGHSSNEARFLIAFSVPRNIAFRVYLEQNVSSFLSDEFIINKNKVVHVLTFYSYHLLPDIVVPKDCSKEELIIIIEHHNYMRIETKYKDGLMFVRRKRDSKGNYIFLRIDDKSVEYSSNLLAHWKSYRTGENYYLSL